MRPGFLEPVADQIGPAGHAVRVDRIEGGKVSIPELSALLAASQEWRIAHDDLGDWPRGFRAVRVEQGVAVLDARQRWQDGVGGVLVAIAPAPLNVADPDGDAGQFGGVVVDLQPEEVMWPGLETDLGLAVP